MCLPDKNVPHLPSGALLKVQSHLGGSSSISKAPAKRWGPRLKPWPLSLLLPVCVALFAITSRWGRLFSALSPR